MKAFRVSAAGAVFCASVAACSDGASSGPVPAVEFGQTLFSDHRMSASEFNGYSCATCHAASESDTRKLSGYSLRNSVHRPSWWGGYETRYLGAVNTCLIYFMLAPEPLSADDPKAKALYEYLLSISPEQDSGARPMTVVRNIADVPGGDAARGAKVYEAACLECHGKTHSGEGRLSERAVVLPEVVDNYAEAFPGVAPRLVVIEKIRHGQFFGVGGSMPLFTLESLSDEDVASLLAYLGL